MQHDVVIADPCTIPMRPRLEARRRAFLEAATAVFLDKGYAHATLDDVIARSGGSRQTLYALFGGKRGLFEALVADRCEKVFAPLAAEGRSDRSPEEVLTDFATRYLERVIHPDALGVYRVVVAEGVSMQGLAKQFWDVGPGRVLTHLADYLAEQARKGELALDDPELAAHQFWGMLLGQYHMECLLGVRDLPAPAEIARFVRQSVTRFLNGCRPEKEADGGGISR